MSRITTTANRLSEPLAANAGAANTGKNLICDKEQLECASFEKLRAELRCAFAAPDANYTPMTAAEIIARNER